MKIRLLDEGHGLGGDENVKYPVEVDAVPYRIVGYYYVSEDEMARVGFDMDDFRVDREIFEAECAEDGVSYPDEPCDPGYPCWVFGPNSVEVIS